ncbi:PREDICTED: transcription repressor OFP1-like isoform X1 [Ipomoea nil]|uniref:transcription repressor OFP1-like isoform X1 n=1 Tax=Ipomoea nil TaxID=35883 RepID=UPI0009015B2D|nr:PREDICTED: transcription repressor OFP1-like isoform X1 [Ipomoea nil]
MGNYKFRFSEIIPNAWFYKLKEMGNKTRNKKHLTQISSPSVSSSSSSTHLATSHSHHRKSYYISRDLNAPPKTRVASPRKSAKKRRSSNAKTISTAAATPVSSPDNDTSSSEPDRRSDETLSLSPSCDTDTILPPQLPPIITKASPKTEEKEQRTRPVRRHSGLKLRTNSPRMGRRIQGRKSVSSSQSFAVVKTSQDPRRDFRESMVEMIVENNIRASKDLEDLLACYLSLNSDEYHDLIIKVFKQIWFDMMLL